MFGESADDHDDQQSVVTLVDAELEEKIDAACLAVQRYLGAPAATARRDLLEALETLDEQLARGDAYRSRPGGWRMFGSGGGDNGAVGATASASAVTEVPRGVFQAQVELVRAAKDEVRASTPATAAALAAAAAALDHQTSVDAGAEDNGAAPSA